MSHEETESFRRDGKKKQEQKQLYLQQIKHLYFTATSQKSQKA